MSSADLPGEETTELTVMVDGEYYRYPSVEFSLLQTEDSERGATARRLARNVPGMLAMSNTVQPPSELRAGESRVEVWQEMETEDEDDTSKKTKSKKKKNRKKKKKKTKAGTVDNAGECGVGGWLAGLDIAGGTGSNDGEEEGEVLQDGRGLDLAGSAGSAGSAGFVGSAKDDKLGGDLSLIDNTLAGQLQNNQQKTKSKNRRRPKKKTNAKMDVPEPISQDNGEFLSVQSKSDILSINLRVLCSVPCLAFLSNGE